jgi:16S rRNA (guanine(966)-N(2))-methyltransferase RsmD
MRITGGEHRSRSLAAPRGDATRPTSDRVREALFAILGGAVGLGGARVLDLYAGTGALGLEALSRGAARAMFVERARPAVRTIVANAEALGVRPATTVVPMPVERAAALVHEGGPFEVVFADPPYDDVTTGAASRAICALLAPVTALLAPSGVLVLEHRKDDPAPPLDGLRLRETRRYGDTCLSFYDAEHAAPAAAVQR